MSDRLSELIRRLRIGVPMKPSRWSGDTHADDGGEYEIEQADALMMEAADALTEVQASRKLIADLRALPDVMTWTADIQAMIDEAGL